LRKVEVYTSLLSMRLAEFEAEESNQARKLKLIKKLG